jgi:thiol-disulfide isomerase/thioredoxin
MRRGSVDIRRAFAAAATLAALSTMSASAFAGDVAPDCVLHVGSRDTRLSALHGKVVYVDFWASWCTSCVLSFPFLNQMNRDYAGKGLAVVGVGMDEKADDAQRFLGTHPATFTIALNGNADCARGFGVSAMPSSFLLDREGVVRYAHQGFRLGDTDELRMMVKKLLAEGGTP